MEVLSRSLYVLHFCPRLHSRAVERVPVDHPSEPWLLWYQGAEETTIAVTGFPPDFTTAHNNEQSTALCSLPLL